MTLSTNNKIVFDEVVEYLKDYLRVILKQQSVSHWVFLQVRYAHKGINSV